MSGVSRATLIKRNRETTRSLAITNATSAHRRDSCVIIET